MAGCSIHTHFVCDTELCVTLCVCASVSVSECVRMCVWVCVWVYGCMGAYRRPLLATCSSTMSTVSSAR